MCLLLVVAPRIPADVFNNVEGTVVHGVPSGFDNLPRRDEYLGRSGGN